jgi:sulfur-oxidizing protein SoxZ
MAEKRKPRRRIKLVPDTAAKGEIITVKTLAEHEMKSGVRFTKEEIHIYPRFIINKMICHYDGEVVFSADWGSGISANPYLAFKLRANTSGPVEIEWIDDDGERTYAVTDLTVTEDDSSTGG